MKLFQAFGGFAGQATALDGSFALIQTVTASGDSSIIFDNVFTGEYDQYRVHVNLENDSADSNFTARFRSGGVSETTSDYDTETYIIAGAGTAGINDLSQNRLRELSVVRNGEKGFCWMDIADPSDSRITTIFAWTNYHTATPSIKIVAGRYGTSTSFDGIEFIADTGTVTGEISLYGWRVN